MTQVNVKYRIKCWDDCVQAGCPGHQIEIRANNTSNSLYYLRDGEGDFEMDFDELEAFIKQVHDMRHWVEIDRLFKELADD